jgi:acyl-CoA synthetase (AMP-forming)/AMP-acid ligase II
LLRTTFNPNTIDFVEELDTLAMHARGQPDKVALIAGERRITFAEYDQLVNRAGHLLADLGVQPGDRVASMAYNSIEGAIAAQGGQRLGSIGVPISYRLNAAEVAYIIADSGAGVVLAGEEFIPVVDEARAEVKDGSERRYLALSGAAPQGWLDFTKLLAEADRSPVHSLRGPGLPPSMIYTSGTTGSPKGAYRKNGIDLVAVMRILAAFEITGSDVYLLAGPGYHSAPLLFGALTSAVGGTTVIEKKFDAEEALGLIDRHRCTLTVMAPTLLQRIMDLPGDVRGRYDVSSIRALIMAAAPCPFSLKERAIAYFGEKLWEFYGSTETGVNLVLRPEDQLSKPGSCGLPLDGVEIELRDEGGHEVATGQPGELWVRSGSLAEYYNRPDATAGSMRDGFFSVGDVAYRDEEGFYYICDRRVDMIISGGVNIYPAEVEAVLFAHPAVRDVAVIGVPDDHWGESVKAVVELKPGAAATEAELIGWCGLSLAGYKRPRSVDFVLELPRDLAGKLQKRKVREPYWAGSGRKI